MSTLHIFNPSHDEALAANSPFYTPTKAARQQAEKYAALPLLWCADGDAVLVSEGRIEETLVACGEKYPFAKALLVDKQHLLVEYGKTPLSPSFWQSIDAIEPWGWNAHLVHFLKRLGAPERLLPSETWLQNVRRLSSRLLCVEILPLLIADVPGTIGESIWCNSVADALNAINTYGTAMLKAPWSCSGRGVFRAQHDEAMLQRIKNIIDRQGAIEVEPLYPNRGDLALEFTVTPTGILYEGLSVFSTSPSGSYLENTLMPEAQLLERIPLALRPTLHAVCEALQRHLSPLLCGNYTGPLGVDMMITADHEGNSLLHPCIEINLRRTMGYVAVKLLNRR